MSKNSRNSRFTRKSGKNRAAKGENPTSPPSPPRRAYGMHKHPAVATPKSPKQARKGAGRDGGALWIWGYHAVMAVLNNPKRTIHDLIMTEAAQARINLPAGLIPPKIVLPAVLDKQFPKGTSHQGVAVKVAPLEWPDISDIASDIADETWDEQRPDPHESGLILVLDQITDPHNVGAMLRLASAFGVRAVVMQDRKAPPLSGACAKVAVGCLETIPVCLVTNIANTLQDLKKQGWLVTGLAGETQLTLAQALSGGPKNLTHNHVIVMGAEGPGLRPRVRDCCDQLARISMSSTSAPGQAESLNVATAAAIALYETRRIPSP